MGSTVTVHVEHPSGQAIGILDPSRPNPAAAAVQVAGLPPQVHVEHPAGQSLNVLATLGSHVPTPSIPSTDPQVPSLQTSPAVVH